MAMSQLAGAVRKQGRYDEAEALYIEALELRGRVFGPDNYQYAHGLAIYSGLLRRHGKYEQALDWGVRALDMQIRHGGRNSDVAGTQASVGHTLLALGRPEDAIPHYRESALISRDILRDEARFARSLGDLGKAQLSAGDMEGAAASFLEQAAIRERLFGADDDRTREAYANVARVSVEE